MLPAVIQRSLASALLRAVRLASNSAKTLPRASFLTIALWTLLTAPPLSAQVSVTTYHNDNARTGLNSAETTLTPLNVTVSQFGRLFSQAVDGAIYAQPLVVPNVAITGKGSHNVVFVATEHNSVYAFDADNVNGANANPLWQINLGPSVTNPGTNLGSTDIPTEVGITGTPVIDVAHNTLFVVAKTLEGPANQDSSYVQRLHALDIRNGQEKAGSPVVISASVAGTGPDNVGGQIVFNARRQNQRPGLLLLNGVVYIGWASHGDTTPYHGWLIGYNVTTFAQTAAYNVTPNGTQGGIWQGGAAPAADANGNIFFLTGNGTFDLNTSGPDAGDTFLKLSTTGGANDYFTPFNQQALNAGDLDLGSGGALLLPDQSGSVPHLLVSAGKEGKIYLLNRDALGQFHAYGDHAVQTLPGQITGLFGMPAFWNNTLYFLTPNDVMKTFPVAPLLGAQVDYSGGFTNTGLTRNGTAVLSGSKLRLTDGNNNEAGSAFANSRVYVGNFHTEFTLQMTKGASAQLADGMTFCIQGIGPTALGPGGGGLGYGPDNPNGAPGILQSVCVKFDIYSNQNEGTDSTGLYTNGQSPTNNAIDLSMTGVDFKNLNPIHVVMDYDGTTLSVSLKDTVTNATASQSYTVDIPAFIGSPYGFAGFTGGTGGLNVIQDVLSWTFTSPTTSTALLSYVPASKGTQVFGFPGATPSISANGTGAGIVWVLQNDAYSTNGQAILRAYDATNVATEFYNSTLVPVRDSPGPAVKFTVPTVANGKVYIGTQTQLSTYGLNPTPAVDTPTISPNGGSIAAPITLSDTTPGATIHYTTDGTDPTESSPTYTSPILLTACATLKARAFKPGYFASAIASAVFTQVGTVGAGDGLAAEYHAALNFGGPPFTRVDPTINFGWPNNEPYSFFPPANWSVRWTGTVQPEYTDTYTFYTLADDGVRLWVNGQLLIDDWNTRSQPKEDSATIALTAGQRYSIKLEYYEATGTPVMKLSWSSDCQVKDIIPQTQLYSNNNKAQVALPVISPNGGVYQSGVTVTITDATQGAVIRYTTDGSLPTSASPQYTGPIKLTASATVNARAFLAGDYDSAVASQAYLIFTLPGGKIPIVIVNPPHHHGR